MAAEPKTKPTDVPVEDFIAAVDNPTRRADALVVRDMLAEVTGEQPVMWGPSIIGYGSYRGPTGDWPITGFSPRKANTVLYVLGFPGQDELLARLGKHKTGNACLYINRLSDVDLGVLRQIAERSVAATRAGKAGC
ncbi:DUF1801 domain-containing protein [Brevundimonas sp.]|uniref:DUF1801 domain-containing protein n=1 Tax=Brevundimonas sp. TaxID=1871086 RepID=UPI0025F87B23|nr:DUF1801 domain-containing protein [Brevundimonas sp.]